MLRIAQEALTFDDVLLIPGYSEVTAKDVSIKTQLTRGISLNIPLISAAMDTVTESRLAISIAQEGGIGIIHKSMSIDAQAKQVRIVKKYEAGGFAILLQLNRLHRFKSLLSLLVKTAFLVCRLWKPETLWVS